MPAFNWDYLAQKYAIQKQQADSATKLASANANLVNTTAQLAPEEAGARLAATMKSPADPMSGAGAAASLVRAPSENNLNNAQAAALRGQTLLSPDASQAIQNRFNQTPQPTQQTPGFRAGTSDIVKGQTGYANGTSGVNKVPGQGDGTVDTQKTILAPGEAVLNRAAAEHLGRDTISLLNAIGQHKMGMGPSPGAPADAGTQASSPTASDQTVPGYALGDEYVGSPAAPPGQGPGQTITNGQWGTPIGNSGNTGIRQSLGLGMPRPVGNAVPTPKSGGIRGLLGFAGGTDDVPNGQDSMVGVMGGQGYASGTDNVPGPGTSTADPRPNPVGNRQMWDDDVEQAQFDKDAKDRTQNENRPDSGWGAGNGPTVQNGKNKAYEDKGYAKGTAKVPAKGAPPKSKSAPGGLKGDGGGPGGSSLSPDIIQAIMHMGQGMGGMPPPNAAGPMPPSMPMPQVAQRGR